MYMVESQSDPDIYYNASTLPCILKSAITKYHNQLEFSVVPLTDGALHAVYHYIASDKYKKQLYTRGSYSSNWK